MSSKLVKVLKFKSNFAMTKSKALISLNKITDDFQKHLKKPMK